MSKTKTTFQKLIQDFFTSYLDSQRGISDNTIDNYRNTFIQLLMYIKTILNISSDKIKIEDITVELVTNFLNWLEESRHVSISTRNNRLAGIKSFFKYISYHYPEYLEQCTIIREIEFKKNETKPVNYLTVDAIKHLLSTFDTNNKKDLRNLCIVMLLYESGARVSELTQIKTFELNLTAPHKLCITWKRK
ncbi:MAG: phage integrase N-terminal SAM-like domain-containing protein [Erysipelotrichaceae bacterium]|nr:phage integrase N-terminal SAM-like domain-containing protein [Erysipelotrichaceae bacterium]